MSTPEKTPSLESKFEQHAIPRPSQELRQQVLSSAKEAWDCGAPPSNTVPWLGPILQLAASIVIGGALLYAVSRYDEPVGRQIGQSEYQAPEIDQAFRGMNPSEVYGFAIRERRRAATAEDFFAHAERFRLLLENFNDQI